MKCENCRQNDATIHLTEIVQNVKSEYHLCEKCARRAGINSRFSNFSLSVPDMLSFLDLDEVGDAVDNMACTNCGLTFFEYKRAGKLGCAHCYNCLKTSLGPIIRNYHGNDRHVGKVPSNYTVANCWPDAFPENKNREREKGLAELRSMLQSAIADERYEDAAVLRDRIREMEMETVPGD